METGRLPAFSCSDGAFLAQPDGISARKRGARGKMVRVTQTDNQLVCSNQDCGNIMTERETQKLTIEKKERRDPQGTQGRSCVLTHFYWLVRDHVFFIPLLHSL